MTGEEIVAVYAEGKRLDLGSSDYPVEITWGDAWDIWAACLYNRSEDVGALRSRLDRTLERLKTRLGFDEKFPLCPNEGCETTAGHEGPCC